MSSTALVLNNVPFLSSSTRVGTWSTCAEREGKDTGAVDHRSRGAASERGTQGNPARTPAPPRALNSLDSRDRCALQLSQERANHGAAKDASLTRLEALNDGRSVSHDTNTTSKEPPRSPAYTDERVDAKLRHSLLVDVPMNRPTHDLSASASSVRTATPSGDSSSSPRRSEKASLAVIAWSRKSWAVL